MQGVMFDKKHSYGTWGLMLKRAPNIAPPEPNTKYVEIPGAECPLDLTELLSGKVRYKNREIELEFVTMAGRDDWPAIYSDILDALHGKAVRISFDNDPLHSYKGRVTVEAPEFGVAWIILKMKIEAEPFKISVEGVKRL